MTTHSGKPPWCAWDRSSPVLRFAGAQRGVGDLVDQVLNWQLRQREAARARICAALLRLDVIGGGLRIGSAYL
ncbi:hypothetical protein P3T35_002349 [Kitasatospora sp. GP30]|uniref:hypothetical protein n=1 Tax=Kitasatospora sp. GP30 TaxID=3035084 RepID=UPI001180B48F|nr:hypothetical protein [Kitasatospora sp. GP30]MDH6140341.1 hypothetical protein [Kitasatospora sp. GP30]